VQVFDVPAQHSLDHFATLGRHWHKLISDSFGLDPTKATAPLLTWCHDHDGAYRQLPVREPWQAWVILMTPHGPTLWRHNVLLFGSVGSVWGYNRTADALVQLSRVFLAAPCLHYVDDYGGIEPAECASSAFTSFASLNGKFGFVMKPSKAQKPACPQKVQGAEISFDQRGVTVAPTANRRAKMHAAITLALTTNQLHQMAAATLAGKLCYLLGTLFGRIGRAALKPIYGRLCHQAKQQAHRTAASSTDDTTNHRQQCRTPVHAICPTAFPACIFLR
jgi:hypothetical protein